MSSITLKNIGTLVGSQTVEKPSITIADGIIVAFGADDGTGEMIDCEGMTVLPGFIDMHIHGAVGVDVNAADTDGLLKVAGFLARNGVTAWMPTLVPDSDENYRRVISAIDRLMEIQIDEPVAQAVGVHYEGVFANEHMCGALRPEFFKKFSGTELSELPKLRHGVHMMTFAPEIDGGIDLATELRKQGWVASIGHTRADANILDRAFAEGASHLTHFYNAMTGMHHRDPGVVGWALAEHDVTFDVIADGIHVHPKMLELACRVKSPERVPLISDSVAPTGLGDGEFEIWDEKVTVENGRTRNARGSIAGSVITMLDAVKRMLAIGFSPSEVSLMASLNPAKLVGLDQSLGSIDVGKRADLVAFDEHGDVRFTMIGGRTVRQTKV
jgi:N-acetylglucosamine-6-phosphate deacetylase